MTALDQKNQSFQKLAIKAGACNYDIIIKPHVLADCATYLQNICRSHVIIITDDHVAPHYLPVITKQLHSIGHNPIVFQLSPGEHLKSFSVYQRLASEILERSIDRQTTLIALGGGVIGDLTGFLASTLYRGLSYIQIPTSLLAQIDSSVGGKTGINVGHAKNSIGTFYPPALVLIDPTTLCTLPKRHMQSGYGEMIKYAYLHQTENLYQRLTQGDGQKLLQGNLDVQVSLITEALRIKNSIVSQDEKEKDLRRLLNFGHTFAHGLEAATGFSEQLFHGEAVLIGILMALKLSYLCGKTPDKTPDLQQHLIELGMDPFYLKNKHSQNISSENVLHLMKTFDKKMQNKTIQFILYQTYGHFTIETADDALILTAMKDYI